MLVIGCWLLVSQLGKLATIKIFINRRFEYYSVSLSHPCSTQFYLVALVLVLFHSGLGPFPMASKSLERQELKVTRKNESRVIKHGND